MRPQPRPTARSCWLVHGQEHALPTDRQPTACQRWTPLGWDGPGSTPTIPLILPPTRERRLRRRRTAHQTTPTAHDRSPANAVTARYASLVIPGVRER